MGRYFSHPSGGPAWSRDRGYHTPALPSHIKRTLGIIRASEPTEEETAAKLQRDLAEKRKREERTIERVKSSPLKTGKW